MKQDASPTTSQMPDLSELQASGAGPGLVSAQSITAAIVHTTFLRHTVNSLPSHKELIASLKDMGLRLQKNKTAHLTLIRKAQY